MTVSAHVLLYLRHYRGGVSEVVVKHLHETEGPVDHQGVTRRVLEALTPSRFPAMELRPDVLYVEDGNIMTSAGLSAGYRSVPASGTHRLRRRDGQLGRPSRRRRAGATRRTSPVHSNAPTARDRYLAGGDP
ncbi:hypothetical protein [Nocardia amikacinitolerans]|uniref:hypothetical protein n=1 Tax=Nocardia amikacinitolerans TaxID=756689 RepID=UPI001C53BBE5|nr:hypothetical protein [Nocardia amikacinitolerans]